MALLTETTRTSLSQSGDAQIGLHLADKAQGVQEALHIFETQLAPFFGEPHPLHLSVDTATQISQFRAWKKIPAPDSDAYDKAYTAEREGQKHTVLVAGAGKAGETAAKLLEASGIHTIVIENTMLNGGRAANAIDFIKHRSAQKNALRDGATVLSNPQIDTIYNLEVPLEKVADFAKQIGCSAVVWVGGGEENLISTVDDEVPGVYTGMSFITKVNEPLMRREKSLRQIAHEMNYYMDPQTGIPLPTIVQGGGKVGEDVIVKDVAMRVALALERKAQYLFGAPEDAEALAAALSMIDAIEPSTLFGTNSILTEKLTKLGITHEDIGETILQYHDDRSVMKLKVLPEKDIVAEIRAREEENEARKQANSETTDLLPTDRRSVEKFLRARPAFSAGVVKELAAWQEEFGITVDDKKTIGKTYVRDGVLYMLPVSVDGEKKSALGEKAVGLVATAIGFKGVKQLKSADMPIYYGAMALTGDGALGATITNITQLIKETVVPDLQQRPLPTSEQYTIVQEHVALIREQQGDPLTDPVERLFLHGPKTLLEDWSILSSDHAIEFGTTVRSANEAIDVERMTRTTALIEALLASKYTRELLESYPLSFEQMEQGMFVLSLRSKVGETILPLHIAVGSNWSLYEVNTEGNSYTEITTLPHLLQILDLSLGSTSSWGTFPYLYADELRSLREYGEHVIALAKKNSWR